MTPGFYLFLGWGVALTGAVVQVPTKYAVRVDCVIRERCGVVTFVGAMLTRCPMGWRVVEIGELYAPTRPLAPMEPPR